MLHINNAKFHKTGLNSYVNLHTKAHNKIITIIIILSAQWVEEPHQKVKYRW